MGGFDGIKQFHSVEAYNTNDHPTLRYGRRDLKERKIQIIGGIMMTIVSIPIPPKPMTLATMMIAATLLVLPSPLAAIAREDSNSGVRCMVRKDK